MIYELVMFGGTFFWIIFAAYFLLITFVTDREGQSIPMFIVGILVFYALSRPPILDWPWIVSYFVIGLVWWFIVFNLRLNKIRKYLKDSPSFIEDGKVKFWYITDNPNKALNTVNMDREVRRLYESEPSFLTFSERLLCWPFSLAKFAFCDMMQGIYDVLSHTMVRYKNRILGINNG